jgi:hypothetical protein
MNFISHNQYSDLYSKIEGLNLKYLHAKPFSHIILDDIFDPVLLNSVLFNFPKPSGMDWKYDNALEKKLAKDHLRDFPAVIKHFIHELMEKEFVDFLEALTSIHGLTVDHHLNGAGLHQSVRGGKLDIHADYNYHPKTKLDRRINVLIYLNQNWDREWKGNLEFWDESMSSCVTSIEPIFNRMVIFSTTDTAYHGFPDPLECPESMSRKSIAMYYYTNGRPDHERSSPHSTLYQKRPQDPDDQALSDLRLKRSIRRIDP